MSNIILQSDNLHKNYTDGRQNLSVIKGINIQVNAGDRIAIMGPSGSGKSTLLHLLGGLDKPSEGVVKIENQDWFSLSEKKRCQIRNASLGFVYQFHHLLPELTAIENVMMTLCLGKANVDIAVKKSKQLLTRLGLGERLMHKPSQLSGGERQRVAIARALVHEPLCILADEPTGNLDSNTAKAVFDAFLALNATRKTALVIVTHDANLAKRMDKVFTLQDGHLIETTEPRASASG